MKDLKPTCRLALVQCAPVLFDKAKTTAKTVSLIAAAAADHGRQVLRVDAAGLPRDRPELRDIGRRLRREAILSNALIVLTNVERAALAADVPLDRALL